MKKCWPPPKISQKAVNLQLLIITFKTNFP